MKFVALFKRVYELKFDNFSIDIYYLMIVGFANY